MYTSIQLRRITEEYLAEIAAIPGLAEARSRVAIEQRQREMIERYEIDSADGLLPFLSTQIDKCDMTMKEVEFSNAVHSLQIDLLTEASSSADGRVDEAVYRTRLDEIFESHVAHYEGYAKDRLKTMRIIINDDGEEEPVFEYDRDELARRVARFRSQLEPTRESLSLFCHVANNHGNFAEFKQVIERILEIKRDKYDELLYEKTNYAKDYLNLDRESLQSDIENELTILAERNFDEKIKALTLSLHHYCETGNIEKVEALLNTETSAAARELVNQKNHGHYPLHIACQKGHTRLARILLRAGANPDSLDGEEEDEGRMTARDYARTSRIADELFPAPRRARTSTAATMQALAGAAAASSESIEPTTEVTTPRLTPRPEPRVPTCWDFFVSLFSSRKVHAKEEAIVDIHAPVRSVVLTH